MAFAFDIEEHPVRDRTGNIVGTDIIKVMTSPGVPATIADGSFLVKCGMCGRSYQDVSQAVWDSWPTAPKTVAGQCGCITHFI